MTDPCSPSPFTRLAAVEAWDAWFRWRDRARLHDLAIEDTWKRVAAALASVEANAAPAWSARFFDAFRGWRLLPDERLLASVGTGKITWSAADLGAVLNVAAFVSPGQSQSVSLALPALADCAAVAVRALDNAALLAGAPASRLSVGLGGVADALALLGVAYDSDAGRAQAAAMARALAEGALRASIQLAAARGRHAGDAGPALARAAARGVPRALLQELARDGVRHVQLTAIVRHPRLAALANGIADAVDPLDGTCDARGADRSAGGRSGAPATAVEPAASLAAQLALRAAMQPWIDVPVTYPLLAFREPDAIERREIRRHAARHGLAAPAWRRPLLALHP